MAMGVSPSSNWAQRVITEVCYFLTKEFAAAQEDFWHELERRQPAFARFRAARRRLSKETGRDEARCFFSFGYTDDIVGLVLSAKGVVDYLALHHNVLGPRGLMGVSA